MDFLWKIHGCIVMDRLPYLESGLTTKFITADFVKHSRNFIWKSISWRMLYFFNVFTISWYHWTSSGFCPYLQVIASEFSTYYIQLKAFSNNCVATSGCIALEFRFLLHVYVVTWTPSVRAWVSGIVVNYPWLWFSFMLVVLWILSCLSPPPVFWWGSLDESTGCHFGFLSFLFLWNSIHFSHIFICHVYYVSYLSMICDPQYPKIFVPVFLGGLVWK